MTLAIARPLAELGIVGAFLREPPEQPHDRAGLAKAKAELLGTVDPAIFHESILQAAWFAIADEFAETGQPTPAGIAGRIAGRVATEHQAGLIGLFAYGQAYAEGIRSNGRMLTKLLTEGCFVA